jgi:hypothetical protein
VGKPNHQIKRYEFMPSSGGPIEMHSLLSLALRLEKFGITEREFNRIAFATPQYVVRVRGMGDFRRVI